MKKRANGKVDPKVQYSINDMMCPKRVILIALNDSASFFFFSWDRDMIRLSWNCTESTSQSNSVDFIKNWAREYFYWLFFFSFLRFNLAFSIEILLQRSIWIIIHHYYIPCLQNCGVKEDMFNWWAMNGSD